MDESRSGREFDDLWGFDDRIRREGYGAVAGVDEAGRGCLAGPVVAGAVVFPPDFRDRRVRDSKQLTAAAREELYDVVVESALAFGIGTVSRETIDQINILRAALLAMAMAIESLSLTPDIVLVDGNRRMPCAVEQMTVVSGDRRSLAVAGASILAKVHRDRIMCELDLSYPEYGFASNKGYGSKAHLEALERHGPCPAHRRSFSPVRHVLEASFQFETQPAATDR